MSSVDRKAVIATEQAAVNRAYAYWERSRSANKALTKPRPWNQDCPESSTPFIPDTPPELLNAYDDLGGQNLVVLRVDIKETSRKETFYIGRRSVKNPANGNRVVISWSSPLAIRCRQASASQPGNVLLRRILQCKERRVLDYRDDIDRRSVPLQETERKQGGDSSSSASVLGNFLLEEINRGRGERMRDIVATIERDQLRLVASEYKGVLIIQGGPGTGKTAVGLHRVAWLLDPENKTSIKPSEILVVLPHRGLLDYVSAVPQQLGISDVSIKALDQLWADEAAGSDDELARRVKSDERMAQVLRRALENTVRFHAVDKLPNSALRISHLDRTLRLSHQDVRTVLHQAFNSPGSFKARRAKAIDLLLDRLITPYVTGRGRGRSDSDIRTSLRKNKAFRTLVNRLWPEPSAPQTLRRLYSSRGFLTQSSSGLLTKEERESLFREPHLPLTPEDAVCLDELRYLIDGDVPRRYRHLVIDEAQDLTPMQARALARRCPSRSITVLGDLAQATGPHLYQSWDQIARILAGGEKWILGELKTGYRVPREVIDFAAPLAKATAPKVSVPESLRPPVKDSVTTSAVAPWRLLEEAAAKAVALAGSTDDASRSVALVVPDDPEWTEETEQRLKAARSTTPRRTEMVRVLPVSRIKGMEFDHVVVVEPTVIADGGPAGLNQLYVALTRCTQTLTVVHAAPLPRELSSASDIPGMAPACDRRPLPGPPVESSSRASDELCQRLINEVSVDRQDPLHESLRTGLTAHLAQAGLRPEDSPVADIFRRTPDGLVLYEVLGSGGRVYLHMRDGAVRLLEVAETFQEKIHRKFLVLAGEPVEPWAAASIASVFGISVIWKRGDGWAGHDRDLALRE